ncbi:MAG TPA: peptidase inhibitor family I36 protein [Vicinamibacterales bacterium]|jgi:hypothetical protein|nr:peptidase inhibitor family I36 protein [Vicinamibacterales bacterium]
MNTTRVLAITSAVAALSLSQAGLASAQIRWGHGATPRSGACFYEDSNFQGRYFCVGSGESMATLPNGMGDKISSIRTFGGAEVMVFRDRDFRGASTRFGGDTDNLKRRGWNDTISSIRIGGGGVFGGGDQAREREHDRGQGGYGAILPQWGHGPMTRNGACFFEDSNYRGRYFCVERGDSLRSLPAGFNDRISSIRLFGRNVEIYVNDDFHGKSRRLNHDTPNLGSSWGDKISSVRVF